MFILCVCVCVCRKYSCGQLKKNMICLPMCVCVHVGKVYRNKVSIVGQSKADKKIDLNWINVYVWVYIYEGPWVWAFCFLKPTRAFFMIFGDNVLHSSSQQKNVACFFAVSCVRCLQLSVVLASSCGMP